MARILYVDDDDDIREVAELAIGLDADLQVRTCSSGREALAAAARWQPHLILLDVMMPQMDGPTTLIRLREQGATAHIPTVFITARAQANEVERFVALGALGVIPKPFDPLKLASAVRYYLDEPDIHAA